MTNNTKNKEKILKEKQLEFQSVGLMANARVMYKEERMKIGERG